MDECLSVWGNDWWVESGNGWMNVEVQIMAYPATSTLYVHP